MDKQIVTNYVSNYKIILCVNIGSNFVEAKKLLAISYKPIGLLS